MADRGVKIFGVETISPDLVYLTDEYPTHKACAERGLTHYENLNNLEEVVNRRFLFFGFPLRLEPAYGSPVRAAAILEETEMSRDAAEPDDGDEGERAHRGGARRVPERAAGRAASRRSARTAGRT